MADERDTRETPRRVAIQALYRDRKIIPVRSGFGCDSLTRCSENERIPLHTGNWVFVGCDYGQAKVAGYSAKILFVAMDRGGYGGADAERFPDTQASFRQSIELPTNPHMGGVRLILIHLVDDRDPRILSGQCALTNAVKCVRHTGRMNTHTTDVMISHCANHLRAEIGALDPDIVITQGAHPRGTILGSFAGLRLIGEFKNAGRGHATVFTNSRLVVLTTPHPARLPGLKWKKGVLPQFLLDAISLARFELTRKLQHEVSGTTS